MGGVPGRDPRVVSDSMLRGVRTGLFHAVVGLGLAACGGVTAASKDAGSGSIASDAGDAMMPVHDSGPADAPADVVTSVDAADDVRDAIAALDAGLDATPDV